ncbi:MAG: hypothetical protein GY810_24855 [Aureispira sp.]|nr:hypothetical protein [Aureispira sp.]
MKYLTLLLLCCYSCGSLYGQDPDKVEYNGETFKVKKIVIKKAEDSIPASIAAPPEKVVTKTISINTKDKKRPQFEEAAILPTIATGEFSLMQVQNYNPKTQLGNKKYVVLQYIINKYGWAQNIKIYDTNDRRLASVVEKKLKATQWNPAKNKNGQAINYLFKKQVVFVNDRTYDEDYYDNY